MGNTKKEELIEAVLQYGVDELQFAGEELLGDREFIAELVRVYDGDYQDILEHASEEIQGDSKFITELAGIKKNRERKNADEEHATIEEDLPEDYISIRLEDVVERKKCGDKGYILSLIEDFGAQAFEYASEELKRDPDVVLEAVIENKDVLKYASEDLKNNRYFIAKLLQDSNLDSDEIVKYASEELEEDIETFTLLNSYGIKFDIVHQTTRDVAGDADVILTLFKYEPECALRLAAPSLRGNKEFFLKLLENHKRAWIEDGDVLEYAEGDIRNDAEVVLAAIRGFGVDQLRGAGSELLNRKYFISRLIGLEYLNYEEQLEILENAGEEPFEDEEFVLEVIDKMGGSAVKYASEELRGDREIILKAVRDCGLALEYASEELRGDREIVLEAVKIHGDALVFASDELKGDKQIVMVALSQDNKMSGRIAEREELLTNHISPELQNDPQIRRLVELANQRDSKRNELRRKNYFYHQIAEAIEPTESMIKSVQAEMIAEETKDAVVQKSDAEQK